MRDKYHLIITMYTEKAFDKIQHPLMIKKNPQHSVYRGKYLNIIKAIYCKPTANIILNGAQLKDFPLRSGTRQECPFLPLLLNLVLRVLATAIRKKNKRPPNRKGRRKTSLFAKDMILHM